MMMVTREGLQTVMDKAEGFIHHGEHLKVGDDDKGDGWREWKSIWHELYS